VSSQLINVVRGLALLAVVALIAALSAGVITSDAQPAFRVRAAPSEQRFSPESFDGNIVAGSISTVAGSTQFVVDRPKKVGAGIDPTQRETVLCRLESVPTEQAALVLPGAHVYVYGSYDYIQSVFYVNIVGTTPESVVVSQPSTSGSGSDNRDNSDNDSDDNDSDDNDSDNDN
jgi:hypothetical protein